MKLIKRSEWPLGGSLLSDFFDDDRFLNRLSGYNSVPAVNVRESDNSFNIEMAAPGYHKEDFSVSCDNGMLTISAERKQENEVKEDNYTRREFGFSSFSRSFTLPTNTNEDDIKANYEDGILKLSIAKKALPNAKGKRNIEIK
jgi:HSP20 family protein